MLSVPCISLPLSLPKSPGSIATSVGAMLSPGSCPMTQSCVLTIFINLFFIDLVSEVRLYLTCQLEPSTSKPKRKHSTYPAPHPSPKTTKRTSFNSFKREEESPADGHPQAQHQIHTHMPDTTPPLVLLYFS